MNFIGRRVWRRKKTLSLIIIEIFLAIVLVFCASYLYKTTYSAVDEPIGFSVDNVWGVKIRHTDNKNIEQELKNLARSLKQRPDVIDAGIMLILPFSDDKEMMTATVRGDQTFSLFGRYYVIKKDTRKKIPRVLEFNVMDRGALNVLNMPLNYGRYFDNQASGQSAIITQALSKEQFGKKMSLRRAFIDIGPAKNGAGFLGIYGVLENYRPGGRYSAPMAQLISNAESPNGFFESYAYTADRGHIVMKMTHDAKDFKFSVIDQLRKIKPDWRFDLVSLAEEERKADIKNQMTFFITLAITVFLMLMVILGLMGVLSQEVQKRSGEIALFRAIGSTKMHIMQLWLLESIVLVAVATVIALLALLPIPFLINQLFDWSMYAFCSISAFVLVTISVIICTLQPALMASQIEPALALKSAG